VLWINMIISITMTVPIAFEPKPYDLMERPPRSPQQPLLSRPLLVRIALISTLNLIFIFGVFAWIRDSNGDLILARTMAIQTLVTGLVIYLFSLSQFWSSLLARLRGQGLLKVSQPLLGSDPFSAVGLGALPQTLVPASCFHCRSSRSDWFSSGPAGGPQAPRDPLPAMVSSAGGHPWNSQRLP